MDGRSAVGLPHEDAAEVDRITRAYLTCARGDPYGTLAAIIVETFVDIDAGTMAAVEREGLISGGCGHAGTSLLDGK